jgi:hypothetical protein
LLASARTLDPSAKGALTVKFAFLGKDSKLFTQ